MEGIECKYRFAVVRMCGSISGEKFGKYKSIKAAQMGQKDLTKFWNEWIKQYGWGPWEFIITPYFEGKVCTLKEIFK